jgi:hypothetical protein
MLLHWSTPEVGSRKQEVTSMGMLLIVLGLAAAGVVADFAVENDLTTAPDQAVSLFGGSFSFSFPEVVLGAAVVGVLAVLLVILGLGLLRGSWGRRKALKRQIADLRQENADLHSKVHLLTAVGADQARQAGATGQGGLAERSPG